MTARPILKILVFISGETVFGLCFLKAEFPFGVNKNGIRLKNNLGVGKKRHNPFSGSSDRNAFLLAEIRDIIFPVKTRVVFTNLYKKS